MTKGNNQMTADTVWVDAIQPRVTVSAENWAAIGGIDPVREGQVLKIRKDASDSTRRMIFLFRLSHELLFCCKTGCGY
jgi:hypothetical protein